MSLVLQVYPNRISITPLKNVKGINIDALYRKTSKILSIKNLSYTKNFECVKNPFKISGPTRKKIIDSINSMNILSSKRHIKMKNKKVLYNFKLSFITLTLPSKQVHSDTFLKKECLNQLLVELRKHYNVKNYVWRAELQKNENIHFHLVLDQYVDFQALRRRWNRILNKYGYVDMYSKKFRNINLSQYHDIRNSYSSCSFQKSQTAFAAGKKCNWSNPNTVDIRCVNSNRDVARYLSKYIAKSASSDDVDDETLNRQLNFGRAWSRSYSLASLRYINKYLYDEMRTLVSYLENSKDKVLKICGDYFTVFYFKLNLMDKNFINFIEKFCYNNAKIYNYPFP